MSTTKNFRRASCATSSMPQGAGDRAAQAEAYDGYTQKRVEIYAEYETQCNREGVVDFAELLLRCYELLQRNEPLRKHYQQRFRTSWSTSSRTPIGCNTPG
jgi:DNA helicase-2/ATP-dependent DNA helicase PcrA